MVSAGVKRARAGAGVGAYKTPATPASRAAHGRPTRSGVLLPVALADPPLGIEPRTLNRNAVLHGIARRYGTEQNATKLFMLLVLMAECFNFKDRVEADRKRKRQATRERRGQRTAA
jgi:hypothetical protein